MDKMKAYLNDFEKKVMLKMVDLPFGVNAVKSKVQVPVQGGKLINSEFGAFVGNSFEFDGLLAFNYYGLYKLSDGIKNIYEKSTGTFPGIKVITATVVNFASILPANVQQIDSDLYQGFAEFKKYMVKLRWG